MYVLHPLTFPVVKKANKQTTKQQNIVLLFEVLICIEHCC